jgi:hypothetical protein
MTDTQFRDTIKTLFGALGSNDPAQRLKASRPLTGAAPAGGRERRGMQS